MAIYSVSVNGIGTTASAAADIKAGATVRLYEWTVQSIVGAATLGFGRPANDGSVVQTGSQLVQTEDMSVAGKTAIASTWSTAPTQPNVFLRRVTGPANTGWGAIWTFPKGLICLTNNGACVWNLAVNSIMCHTVVVDE